MKSYALTHLADSVLHRELTSVVAGERGAVAQVLAHIAEFDARKLYLPAAYPSMYSYCLRELRMSEDAAFKRIHAARAARRFPAIFGAVEDGRLHLSAVVMLAPHLTSATAEELLAAAAHKTKSEIEQLLAERFPRPDVPTSMEAISPPPSLAMDEHAPGRVEASEDQAVSGQVEVSSGDHSPGQVAQHAPGRVEAPTPRPKLTPLAPQRYALQFTIGQSAHDKLKHAQELLGHQISSGDVPAVFERALDALIEKIEKRKFAATDKPRKCQQRPTKNHRHVPAHVRRAVRKRDGDQCTYVSETGQRCPARTPLEFDHIEEVARGGRATVAGIRLRCRAHNQYSADCTFGAEFMKYKREVARRAAAKLRVKQQGEPSCPSGMHAARSRDRHEPPGLAP